MGWVDWLLGRAAVVGPEYVIARPITSSAHLLQAKLDAAIAARSASLGTIATPDDALTIPAVLRGVSLITSMVGQFTPVAVDNDDNPLDTQPSVVTRPDDQLTREGFLSQLAMCLIQRGDAWLWPTARAWDGWPLHVQLLDPSEVIVNWDDKRMRQVVSWRDKDLEVGRDVWRASIGRRVGHLYGLGPLEAGLPALQAIAEAEAYAAAWFASSGVPSVVIKSPGTIGDTEASTIKERWLAGGYSGTPRVLGGGMEADFPGVDPQSAQLLETRAASAREVGRLLGVPAPLLLIDTQGSSVTYANAATLLTEFVRATVAPQYLAPIEQAMSDLLPRGQSVRFDLGELGRVSIAERMDLYEKAVAMGAMDAAEVARREGWPKPKPKPQPVALAPDQAPQPEQEGAAA